MTIVQSGLPLALSIPFILAGWVAFIHRQRVIPDEDTASYAAAESYAADRHDLGIAATAVDVDASLREAVAGMTSLIRSRWVLIEVASDAAIIALVDPNTLRLSVHKILLTAINAAFGGQVLVTATISGGHLHIRITDDGAGTDQRTRRATMREVEALIAMQGGSIAVDARPGRGTTVTLQLPMAAGAEQPAGGMLELPALADQAA